jgi:outer membrane protein insertion porin family
LTNLVKGNTLSKKLLCCTMLASLPLLAQEDFTKIEFEGLTQISQRVALENINLKSDNTYTNEEINRAIKEFYKFDYFKDIWVTNENKILTFHFKEKPFISNLEITGYKTREEELEVLYTQMNIKKGNMYTKKRVESAKKALLGALEREGLVNSVVEISVDKINENSVSVTFEVNKGEEITIKKIDYKGAKVLNTSDFESVIANKEEDCCFTWFIGVNDGEMNYEQLSYDSARIKDLYLQHGYLDATVSKAFSKIDFNTNSANVEYTIVEGEQYKVNDVIIYLDESIAKNEEILPELKLEKGDVFNISYLRKDQEYIKTQVANKGYAFTEVNFNIKPDKKKKEVNIIYNVIPGDKVYINDVVISGNTRTLDRVIRRDIYLAPGDLFNLSDYKDSINKLKRTGYFEDVVINQKRVSSTQVDLEVKVTEAPTGNLVLGGGYGSYEGFMINGSVNDKNIFGSGLDLGVDIDYSKIKTDVSIALTNPAVYDSKYSGTIKIYSDTTELESYTESAGDKDIDEKGILIGSSRAIGRHTRAGITYEFADSKITYSNDSSLNEDFLTSAITPYISFNNTDDYFLPREGFIAGTSYKYAGIGGDAKYGISNTYFKFFYGLEDLIDYDIIFRYKNNLKILFDNGYIPNNTTFYLGGPKSLRGYESYAFKPSDERNPLKNYFSNAVELSFPLLPQAKMRWGLFYDYGMIGEDNFDDIQRSGTGAFISWNSPVGPIQFIFAEALDAEQGDETSSFEFSLGSQF